MSAVPDVAETYELPQRSILRMPMPGDRVGFYPHAMSVFDAVVVSVKYDTTKGWVKIMDVETKQIIKLGHREFSAYAVPK